LLLALHVSSRPDSCASICVDSALHQDLTLATLRNIGILPVWLSDILSAIFSGFQTQWPHRLEVYVPNIT
jgi:hypothetical protein